MLRYISLAGALALLPIQAEADFIDPPYSCTSYMSGSDQVPQGIRALFEKWNTETPNPELLDGLIVKHCTHPDLAAYYTAMLPVIYEFGVCRSRTTDVTALFSEEGELLSDEALRNSDRPPPFQHEYYLMLPAPNAEACPSPDGSEYVWVDGASPGVFRLVMEAWETLLSSANPADHLQLKSVDALNPEESTQFLEALAANPASPFSVHSLRHEPFFGMNLEYELMLNAAGARDQGWTLYFEFTEDGIKVVRVGKWIA